MSEITQPAASLPARQANARPSVSVAAALVLLGIILGAGGSWLYGWFTARPTPETRTVMSRFILPTPVATCKQVMVLAFRAAGFQTVTPDPGDDVGVGASGDRISGAAMCMPALGAATVALAGSDQAQLLSRMQSFSAAVAATNFTPQPRR